MSGAVDLSALKAQAEARAAAQARPGGAGAAPSRAADGGAIIDVTEANFTADVVEASNTRLVVVELRSRRSEASAALSPVLEALAAADGGRWVLAAVDIDLAPGIGQAFGASTVPTVIAVAGGQPVTAFAGPQPEEAVRAWLDDVLAQLPASFGAGGEPVAEGPDPRVAAAEQLAGDGDYDGARAAYRAILHSDPGDGEAAAAIRQLDFVERAVAADPESVPRAAADPADVDTALQAADVELLRGDTAAGFARLITVISRTAGADRDTARGRLLELFELFDPADELVLTARRRLAAALY